MCLIHKWKTDPAIRKMETFYGWKYYQLSVCLKCGKTRENLWSITIDEEKMYSNANGGD